MTYFVLRLIYNVWLLGAGVLFVNAASHALFAAGKPQRKAGRVLRALPLAAVWPISLFSPAGRRVLLNRINQL